MYGIMYAICFLLHGISSAEDIVQEHGSLTISAPSIEPEGKTINTYTAHAIDAVAAPFFMAIPIKFGLVYMFSSALIQKW